MVNRIIVLKNNTERPLLRDLLDVFNEALTFLLEHLRNFFNLANHNVAYFTLIQDPMISGLNTGGFNIDNDSKLLIDRLLAMLNNFLTSNN